MQNWLDEISSSEDNFEKKQNRINEDIENKRIKEIVIDDSDSEHNTKDL